MTGTNKKYLHLGIIEWWQLDCSLGLEMLPIEVNDYSGAFFAYEQIKSEDKWTTVHFDLLYWNICATIIDKASKDWDAMFDVTL